jgi:hypothetical protein
LEMSELLEQIREENERLGLLEDRSIVHWSVDDLQLGDYKTGSVDEHEKSQPVLYASLGEETLSLSNSASELFAMSQRTVRM